MAAQLASSACNRRMRNRALTVLAWAELAQGRPLVARGALARVRPEYHLDLHCLAAIEHALGKTALAICALELDASPCREAAQFLIALYCGQGRFDRAVRAALMHRAVLGFTSLRKLVAALVEARALEPAAILARALFDSTSEPEDAATLVRVLAYQCHFSELERTVGEVVRRLHERGRAGETRALLADLAFDWRLPSGACRQLIGELGELEPRLKMKHHSAP